MTKKSTFTERMSSIEGGEFHKYIPTKEEREHAKELMNKLFTDIEYYESPEDVIKKCYDSSKDDVKQKLQ